MVDNQWIVPYNLHLVTKYHAHINVEICSSISLVKYLYKYVYKGPDRATTVVERRAHTLGQESNVQAVIANGEWQNHEIKTYCEELLHTFTIKICIHIKPGWKWNYYVVVV